MYNTGIYNWIDPKKAFPNKFLKNERALLQNWVFTAYDFLI